MPGVVCAGKAYAFCACEAHKAAWLLLTHRPLEKTTAIRKDDGCFLGWEMGFEPTIFSATN